jgi:hypothetical protein
MSSKNIFALAETPNTPSGFDVILDGVELIEAIQLSSQNARQRALKVQVETDEGWLYFDQGRMVHATFQGRTGVDAVVALLAVPGGRIESIPAPAPAAHSIDLNTDALLLHAVQRLDETRRDQRAPSIAPAAQPSAPPGVAPGARREPTTQVVRRVELSPDAAPAELIATPSAPPAPAVQMVQLSPNGEIRVSRGSDPQGMADVTFYVHQLATALSEGLGLGPCTALYARGPRNGLVVFQGKSTIGVAAEPNRLEFVVRKVGLL